MESTPNATSAIGLALVSTSLFVSAPASPSLSTSMRMPDCCWNASRISCGAANESCVTSLMVVTSSPAGSSDPENSVQPASSTPAAHSTAAARTVRVMGPSLLGITGGRRGRTSLRRRDPVQVRTVAGSRPPLSPAHRTPVAKVQRTRRGTTMGSWRNY